ncbi:MAG: hypothetical protein ACRCZF_06780 [Gemmataceae bacterium]
MWTPTLFAASIYWDLPVLLIVVSLVYSATRHDRWSRILLEAIGWLFRITSFLVMIGVSLYVLSTYPDYRYHLIALGGILFGAYTLAGWYFTGKKPSPEKPPPPPPA